MFLNTGDMTERLGSDISLTSRVTTSGPLRANKSEPFPSSSSQHRGLSVVFSLSGIYPTFHGEYKCHFFRAVFAMPCDLRKKAALIFLRDIRWCLMSLFASVIP